MSNMKERSDKLEKAIVEVMAETEDYEESDFLDDWVVIAHASNTDGEKGGSYQVFVPNGDCPHYRVIGLLRMALKYYEVDDD